MITEQGRKQGEETVILVKNGVYQGCGFFSTNKKMKSFSDYEASIASRQDNSDIQRILRSYRNKMDGDNVTFYQNDPVNSNDEVLFGNAQ